MWDLLVLVLGLLGLWASTELAVRSAVTVAEHFRLSQLFIGLTLLAFGTDLPELVVAINGGLKTLAGTESSGIVFGDAVGSSIAQISLVAGLVAALAPIPMGRNSGRELAFPLLGSIGLLALVCLDGTVTRVEGGILALGFVMYLSRILDSELKLRRQNAPRSGAALFAPLARLAAGLALVVLTCDVVVERALALSDRFGLGQSLVGALLVGLGTSLPELAISANAVLRRRASLSLGNLVGSNVFDCLVPLAAAGLIHPVSVDAAGRWLDLPVLFAITTLFLWRLRAGRRLDRRDGIVLGGAYVAYAAARLALS